MTEKMLTFLSPTPPPPPPTSPDPSDGVHRFNFFPEQHQHNPTKTFVPGQHAQIQGFFLSWGGGGSGLLNLFHSLQKGSNVLLHIFQGVQLFPGEGGGGGPNANFYRNPYNYNL